MGTLHLLHQALPAPRLHHNGGSQADNRQSTHDKPHPQGYRHFAECRLHTAIDLIDHALVLHLVEFGIDCLDKLLVVAHVAVFTWHQGQVRRYQVVKFLPLYQITGLIAEADHGIVFSCRQLVESLVEILDQHRLCSDLRQRVTNRTRLHEGNLFPVDGAQVVAYIVRLAVDNLIIEPEHGPRIVGQILAVGRIDHHSEVRLAA